MEETHTTTPHQPDIYINILEFHSQFLVQSRKPLDNDTLTAIVSIIQTPSTMHTLSKPRTSTPEFKTGFYAPYINYYTTFSTTVISLLEQLEMVHLGQIIRIEEIYTTPQDPLVYRYYDNLATYKEYILESYANIAPAVNQIEFTPWLYQQDVLNYCKQNNIQLPLNTTINVLRGGSNLIPYKDNLYIGASHDRIIIDIYVFFFTNLLNLFLKPFVVYISI